MSEKDNFMKIDFNYKFVVSLSSDSYKDKTISGAMIGSTKIKENREIRKQYGFKSNSGIGYKETEVKAEELLDNLLHGKVFCHLFSPKHTKKDGSFSSSEKNDDNFRGSYVIGVDIDETGYGDMSLFYNVLSLKPTLCYTSYSNKKEGKGARFRLIYVFDQLITNKFYFRYCAYCLNQMIENDTGEKINDTCNLRCSQYFNGTNIDNPDLVVDSRITNYIYSLSDFGISDDGFRDFLDNNCYYKTNNHKKEISDLINSLDVLEETSNTTYYNEMENSSHPTIEEVVEEDENPLYDDELINDMERLDYDEFMKYNRHKFNYFWRVDKGEWINGIYQVVDNNYFSLPYTYSLKHDGQHRRQSVFIRMCLRRVINPNVDANTILFNAYEDIHRFYDFKGIDLGEFLRANVELCFSKTIPEIEDDFSIILGNLRETTRPKKGIIYKNKEARTKEGTYQILDEYYNPNKTVKENIESLKNIIPVNKSTIYNYLKKRNITPVTTKLSDEELLELIDSKISKRKNLQILKDSGVKVDKNRLFKLYDKKS